MVNPILGVPVGTEFGKRGSSWSCRADAAGRGIHTGVDFPCPDGTTAVAARPGIVAHVHYGKAFGRHQVAVRCADGTEDFYAHMRSRVPDGTAVGPGDKVGEVGHDGNVLPKGPDGAHLHFERHTHHGPNWSCSIITDPQASLGSDRAALGGGVPSGRVFLSKLRFGQVDSDSVERLQAALNAHGTPGVAPLPITGNYRVATDAAVRACQAAHFPPADPAGQSFVGPVQAEHLFRFTADSLVDDLPTDAPPQPASFDFVSGAVLPQEDVAELLGISEAQLLDVGADRLKFTVKPTGREFAIEDVASFLP